MSADVPRESEARGGIPGDLRLLLETLERAGASRSPSVLLALRRRIQHYARASLPRGDALRLEMDSEDLAQDALLKLIRVVHLFRGRSWAEFFAFVRRVTAREKVDRAREQARGPEREPFEGPPPDRSGATPSLILSRREERARLKALIESLPEPYRAPLQLRLEEHSYSEIGRRLGLGEAAARKRVSRALEMLRAFWREG